MMQHIKENLVSALFDIKPSRLYAAVVILALLGNGFVAIAADSLYIDSKKWNELVKVFVVILSAVWIIHALKSNRINRQVIGIVGIFLVIFGIAGIRIVFSGDDLSFSKYYYLGYITFIVCISVAILINHKDIPNIEYFLTISSGFVTIYIFIFGHTLFLHPGSSELVETGRLNLNALSPISVGLMSGIFVIMLFWEYRKKSLSFPVFLFLSLVGFGVLIQTNSRGPIIFTFLVLILLINFRIFFILIFVSPVTLVVYHEYFAAAVARLLNIGDLSNIERISIYKNYLNYSTENLFLPNVGLDYSLVWSHNIVLGIYGSSSLLGVFLFIILARGAIYSYKFLNSCNSRFAWINYIFVFVFMVSLFSGGLLDFYFWITLSLLLAYGVKERCVLKNRYLVR